LSLLEITLCFYDFIGDKFNILKSYEISVQDCNNDLKQSEMMKFESLLTTFEGSVVFFAGALVEKRFKPKTKSP
jgi:hypothetical protein